MEEQVLTKKQYKTIKSTYGMLKAVFVISIIMFFFELIINLFTLKQGIASILISGIDSIILIIAVRILLYNKKDNRKNIVGISLFIYALSSTTVNIYNLFTKNVGSIPFLDTVSIILVIIIQIIVIYLSVLLLLKTNEKPFKVHYLKPIFTVYVAAAYGNAYVGTFNIAFKTIATLNIGVLIGYIIGAILIGFLIYVLIQSKFVIYRGLADDVFYENFIVAHPKTAISGYEALHKPAQAAGAGYCANCGAAIVPGANFCRMCGKQTEPQQ